MNIRMTMTAAALCTMTIAGCSSTGNDRIAVPTVTTPAVAAPVTAAPAAVELKTLSNNGSAGQGFEDPEIVATRAEGVQVDRVSGNGTAGTPFTDQYIATSSDATPGLDQLGPAVPDPKSPIVTNDTVMADKDEMAKDAMSADDAAINACFQAGGQVVSWVGDSSGATQACRREDGLEYRLADAQYYQ